MATILVADDQSDIRALLATTLQNRGHSVIQADSGTMVLQVVDQVIPDLAILDVNMPGMEGTHVARVLRSRPETATIPIVLLTALSGEADTLAGYAAGVDDYITKPFNPRAIAARVAALLARAGAGSAPAPRPQGHIIAVAGPKGGVGRTTIAVNLALAAREAANQRTILIDGNIALGDVNVHLDMRSSHTLVDLAPYDGRLDVAAVEGALVRHRSGLEVLLSPSSAELVERVSPPLFRSTVDIAAAIADLVIVDLEARYDDERVLASFGLANTILLVLTPDLASIRNAKSFLKLAPALGIELGRVQLVLNRVHERAGVFPKDVAEALEMPVRTSLPDVGPAATRRVALGLPLVSSERNSEFARGVRRLLDGVLSPVSRAA